VLFNLHVFPVHFKQLVFERLDIGRQIGLRYQQYSVHSQTQATRMGYIAVRRTFTLKDHINDPGRSFSEYRSLSI
jgi:hypothetical protein